MSKDVNLSLFDDEFENELENGSENETQKTDAASHRRGSANLDIVKMSFEGVEEMPWEELFDGFDSIRVITFSAGIDFALKLVSKFSDAEIIFGCEDVMAGGLQEVMAFQKILMERIGKEMGGAKAKLIDRVQDGTLRMFVAREVTSHEKIYLLKSEDGRKRVVMGSANMSRTAFGGVQRENIGYFDGDKAYDWYNQVYESLKEQSTDEIDEPAIALNDEDITDLPVLKTVKVKKVLAILPPDEKAREEMRYVLNVKDLAKKYKPAMPKAENAAGKILLTPEKVTFIKRQIKSDTEKEKTIVEECPQLVIDIENKEASLNGSKLDLSPSGEDVKHDVDLFLKYMDGFSQFHGDVDEMKSKYFAFSNWFFCSPLMATMRDYAIRYNRVTNPYPVYGLLYGKSKAGKTSFLETLLKMMIGQTVKIGAPEFTRTSIDALKHKVKGAPIIVDDMTSARFTQHAVETIKNEEFGVSEHLTNYPAVVISANEDVKAVKPELMRRLVVCHVNAGLTNSEIMRGGTVKWVQRNIGTALYREYLSRMLARLPKLIDDMKDESVTELPDILALSSDVFCGILEEYNGELPEYAKRWTMDDYFSEKVTGSNAIKYVKAAWINNRKAFSINKRNNTLTIDTASPWDADNVSKELPETLEWRKIGTTIVMKLNVAEEFFDIKFRRRHLGRLAR